jgi:hypothetical protein
VALVCAALLTLATGLPEAQERARLEGWIQWISGTRMQVWTGTASFGVDLRDADQSEYRWLRQGDRVLVDGVVATDRSRILARTIWVYPREGGQSP